MNTNTIQSQYASTLDLLKQVHRTINLPLDQLLPAVTTLKAIAYKAKKLHLDGTVQYKDLSSRLVSLDIYRLEKKGWTARTPDK